MLSLHRLSLVLSFPIVAGCTSMPRAQAMPDGTLQMECEGDVSYCIRRAESFCGNDPVEVLAAGSREGQHGDARYSDGSRITTVQFVCGKSNAIDIRLRRRKAPPETAPMPPPPPPPAPAAVCAAGATQQCVGVGACAGGQTCKPDGSGWGECDCGDLTTPPPSPTPPATTPGDAAKPEPTTD